MVEERSAGAIIFRRDKDEKNKIYYLLLKYGSGHWGFAKGNIEENEKPKETTLREIEEETGLSDIKILNNFSELIEYYYYRGGKRIHKIVKFFLGKTDFKDIKISYEHEDYKWVPFNEAINLLSFKNSQNILKKAHNKIKNTLDQFVKK
ncbi:MAG: NUDIX domain-containing protein [Promethearchaeota archaeon]|nr:MAG: NUDIX domain-containing protein [Candidatus Lokiarchaeota archaeon]